MKINKIRRVSDVNKVVYILTMLIPFPFGSAILHDYIHVYHNKPFKNMPITVTLLIHVLANISIVIYGIRYMLN